MKKLIVLLLLLPFFGISQLQVTLKDSLHKSITSLADAPNKNGLLVALGATNFNYSTVNSSTVQLTSNSTFTGSIESIQYEPNVSIIMTSDQPGTLTIYQYIDAAGTYVVGTWTFAVVANTPFNRAFIVNGNYIRVAFQNTGSGTTTTFNLNTAYGIISPVSSNGNVSVSIAEASGIQLTNSTTSVTTSGSVSSGAKMIIYETSSDFSGTIDGNRFLGSGFLPIIAPAGTTLPSSAYVVNAGTLYIRKWY